MTPEQARDAIESFAYSEHERANMLAKAVRAFRDYSLTSVRTGYGIVYLEGDRLAFHGAELDAYDVGKLPPAGAQKQEGRA